MATKFYLTNNTPSYTPPTIRGLWDSTGSVVTKKLSTTKTGGGNITSISVAETSTSNTYDVLLYRGISNPLEAVSLVGELSLVLGVLESSTDANLFYHVHVYITAGNTDTVRVTLVNDIVESFLSSEWPTTAIGKSLGSVHSTIGSVLDGDRLVIEIGYIARNSSATSYTGSLYYGTQVSGSPVSDLTASADATLFAGYFNFTDNLTEKVIVNFSLSPTGIIYEGETSTLGIALDASPSSPVTVNVEKYSGSQYLNIVGGYTLTFDSGNWSTPQNITFYHTNDDNGSDEYASFLISASGIDSAFFGLSGIDSFAPCSGVLRDPFHNYPIRTSKGGGTKCTTCEKRTNCHECCSCVWPYICVDYSLFCSGASPLNTDIYLDAIEYDCINERFDLSVTCSGSTGVYDIYLKYQKIDNQCYATISSTGLAMTGVDIIKLPFNSGSNCRCPWWDFDLGASGSISVRPYELVSIGNQRCIDKGPDDCTAGRCLPKKLCAKFFSAAEPQGVFTTLTWYENDQIEVDCCCHANRFPDTLIARFVNFGPDCSCIAPIKEETIYGPQHGHEITDPGAIVHLKHRVAGTGDYFVNNYPFVPSGSNVWVSSGLYDDLEYIAPGPTDLDPSGTPLIVSRLMTWCGPSGWDSIVEIVNKSGAFASGNTDYIDTPYNSGNLFSNVYRPSGTILSCNPFHLRLSGIVEPDHCYDDQTGEFGTGNLQIHIQEFIGWKGPHAFVSGMDITLYSEVVPTATRPQSSAADCVPKIHVPDQSGSTTLKSRWDVYDALQVWPDPVWKDSEFILDEPIDTTTRIEIYPRPCGGCGDVGEDPNLPDVLTECCSNRIPKTLHVTGINLNDCSCVNSVSFDLIYNNSTALWEGSGAFCSGCSVTMTLGCESLIGSNVWLLTWGFDPNPSTYTWNPTVPTQDYAFTCNPFYWLTRSVSNNTCCNSIFAASLFQWEITE